MSFMVQRETDSDRSSDSGLTSSGLASSGLHGIWLFIARGAWVALVALAAFLVVNGVSAQLAASFSVSSLSQADPRYLGTQEAAALAQLGFSMDSYRLGYVVADVV